MNKLPVLILVLLAQTAYADVMLTFRDKTANVWESYYEKGNQYCTSKTFGEYCVFKKDVISIKKVPAGTEASEFGVSSFGEAAPQGDDALKALQSLNCAQLRAATSETAKEQYRNECMTREELEAWDAQQLRKAAELREAREREWQEAAEAARKKQAEEAQKRYENSRQGRRRP